MSIRIVDPDSGIFICYTACEDCKGVGYFETDLEWDIETELCTKCNGTGLEELAF